MNLKEKVVVITGASSGIGKELAFQFAKKGAKVVLAARRAVDLKKWAEHIESSGGSALYAMFYRHVPGVPTRVLSRQPAFAVAVAASRAANAVAGRFGNKLAVQAVRRS